jgi:hypothetical protein
MFRKKLLKIHFSRRILICERQRALYGIKCVLRIFWQTWLHILMDVKKNSAHCKHVPCNTLTHSTNEDLHNIKRKGDPKSRTISRTSDTTQTRNPCVIKVILLACFTYIDIFKFIKSLLTYWQEFFFYAEVNFWDFVRNESWIEWD